MGAYVNGTYSSYTQIFTFVYETRPSVCIQVSVRPTVRPFVRPQGPVRPSVHRYLRLSVHKNRSVRPYTRSRPYKRPRPSFRTSDPSLRLYTETCPTVRRSFRLYTGIRPSVHTQIFTTVCGDPSVHIEPVRSFANFQRGLWLVENMVFLPYPPV